LTTTATTAAPATTTTKTTIGGDAHLVNTQPDREGYPTLLTFLVSFVDGRWLSCFGNTIYWVPVHNPHRMESLRDHFRATHDPETGDSRRNETRAESTKRIDGYADVFARLPENAMIESMYALDGNIYGIATDLVITLVNIPSTFHSIRSMAMDDLVHLKWWLHTNECMDITRFHSLS
jgi:hypothetical protein